MPEFFRIYTKLLQAYGSQGWWPLIDKKAIPLKCSYKPEFTNKTLSEAERFEICTGAILTQNTSWSNAERAIISLIEAEALDPAALSKMKTEDIACLIKSSGYFNQKARKLQEFSRFFLKNPGPDRQLFLSQWGLGPETVDDMLLYAYHKPVFVIDLYTKRLFSRLGFCSETISYDDIQKKISENIDEDIQVYKEYHALIVRHAKEHCRKKPGCEKCPLEDMCPQKNQT